MADFIKKIIKEQLLMEISSHDMSLITQYGGRVIDSIVVEGFELSLVDLGEGGKTISLTYNNKGFFKPFQQQKQPSEYSGSNIVGIFRQHLIPKVHEWAHKYGKINIGSTNEDRVQKYHKWLCSRSDLKCSRIYRWPHLLWDETQYYFTISK